MHLSFKEILFASAVVGVIFIPALAMAQNNFVSFPYWPSSSSPLIPCSGTDCNNVCQFIDLLQHIFYFILTLGVLGAAPVMVAVGGLMIALGGASSSMISTGKSIIYGVVIGVGIALISWVIVSVFINVFSAASSVGGFGSSINCSFNTLTVSTSTTSTP